MEFRGTTICAVKRNGVTAIAGDGQVTLGESVIFKNSAVKVRRIYGGKVILGFAGSVTDAFSLTEKFEGMLNKFAGNLMRSAVELAELWRSDKLGRKLDAMMITADKDTFLTLEPHLTVFDGLNKLSNLDDIKVQNAYASPEEAFDTALAALRGILARI